MPTQRQHGGAALQPINLVSPAFKGLNTENESALLGQEWATTLNNAIFDTAGRVAARKGWDNQTSTAPAVTFRQVFEYKKADGTSEILFLTDSQLYKNASAPTAITGTGTITDGRAKISNFNEKAIVFDQSGIGVYDGSTFEAAAVNSGTQPSGQIGMAAYGRIWGVDVDGVTIRYSALLDETRWDEADGGGIIDMSQVWPEGQDQIVALGSFNGDIVVFGTDTVVFWSDGVASQLGILPTDLYVSDTINGVGAVYQHAMCEVEGDIWFLSENGVVSIGRLLVQKSNPIQNVSTNNQAFINELLRLQRSAGVQYIDMVYSPREKMVLINFPSTNRQIYFNTLRPLEDGTYRSASWTSDLDAFAYVTDDQNIYGTLDGVDGELFTYNGYSDNGSSFDFAYESGWLDFGVDVQQFLKILKRISTVLLVETGSTVTISWEYDFGAAEFQQQATTSGSGGTEFNVGEFGANGSKDPSDGTLTAGVDVSEYGGGLRLQVIPVPAQGSGQFIKVGVSYDTANANFALQQLTLFAKIGRLV